MDLQINAKLPVSLIILCFLTGLFFLLELIFGIIIKSLALHPGRI